MGEAYGRRSQLACCVEEVVEALDRRNLQSERVGEAEITADADRLRAGAMQRIALLYRRSDRFRMGGRRWRARFRCGAPGWRARGGDKRQCSRKA